LNEAANSCGNNPWLTACWLTRTSVSPSGGRVGECVDIGQREIQRPCADVRQPGQHQRRAGWRSGRLPKAANAALDNAQLLPSAYSATTSSGHGRVGQQAPRLS
jgi:hypothetical protein